MNCPNCGAPITSNRCEYCGTKFAETDSDILRRKIEAENEMLKLQVSTEFLYRNAINAMREYNGAFKHLIRHYIGE